MYSIVPHLDVPELPLGIRPASARGRENNKELKILFDEDEERNKRLLRY